MQPGSLVAANWTFRATGFAYAATTAGATGATVNGASTQGLVSPGLDVVNYAATPADVLDLQDRPAAAFANFPLNVI